MSRVGIFLRNHSWCILLVNVGLALLLAFVTLRTPRQVEENQVGYGYRLVCVNQVMNGDSIIADLDLIRPTDNYGPDIQRLQLTVRHVDGSQPTLQISPACLIVLRIRLVSILWFVSIGVCCGYQKPSLLSHLRNLAVN